MQKVKSIGLFSILILAIFCSAFVFVGCGESNQSFDVYGQVICGDEPIENAEVKADLVENSVLTDSNGIFAFFGLSNTVEISVQAEGYYFKTSSMLASSKTGNMVFIAEKYYTITGRVDSSGYGIAGATVYAVGNINAKATTDGLGYFEIPNVAGECRIVVEKDGYLFEEKTVNIDSAHVTMSGTTDIVASVVGVDASKVTMTVGDATLTLNQDGTFSANDIALGSVVTPQADGYHFEPSNITITRENQELQFTAYELYDVTGVVLSGQTPIADVNVKIGDQTAKTDSTGQFTIANVWGDKFATFSHSIYQFPNETITKDNCILEIQGTFTLNGRILDGTEGVDDFEISVNSKTYTTDYLGNFSLPNVKIGDIVSFTSSDYKLDDLVITSVFDVTLYAEKYYDAVIQVLEDNTPLQNAKLTLGSQEYLTNELGAINLENLIGSHSGTITLDGYKTAEVTLSLENHNLQIKLNKYFDMSLSVVSGQIALPQAQVYINGDLVELTENQYSLLHLYEPVTIYVECEGYNASGEIIADKNNSNLVVNLNYTISGSVINGDLPVSGATITATNELGEKVTTETNELGEFSLNVTGQNTIIPTVTGLNFTQSITTSETYLEFSATYSISGQLINQDDLGQEVPFSDAKVVLSNGVDKYETTTDEDGRYSFTDLSGEYYLETETDTTLYPSSYTISSGGEYSFSAAGYSVSGKVTSGNTALSGVLVRATNADGSFSATAMTDALGDYAFTFLMGEVTITAIKDGYTILDSYEISSADKDRADINFNATFTVKGVVMSGQTLISGALVKVGEQEFTTDETGAFEFSGLTDKVTLTITKDGFNEYTIADINSNYESNAILTFTISGVINIDNQPVADVTISYGNSTAKTEENGSFTLNNLQLGDIITFTKTGYDFGSEILANDYFTEDSQGNEIDITGSYSVTGVVRYSGGNLANVAITYGENTIYTNENGEFTILGLSQDTILNFTLAGYVFSPVTVQGYQSLTITADSFTVTGTITLGGKPLENVQVSSNGVTAKTDSSGVYNLTGLTQSGIITLALSGYEFYGTTYRFTGATTLDFTATYGLKVQAHSGSNTFNVDNYNIVIISGDTTAEIVKNATANYYTIRGLTSGVQIEITADGYNSNQTTLDTFSNDTIRVELDYDITINIDGAILENYTVEYTAENKQDSVTYSTESFTINNLVGTMQVRISKDNYKFTYDGTTDFVAEINFTRSRTVNVSYVYVYSISGKVTVNGTGVYGMRMTAGGVTTYTDVNGNYKIEGLTGQNQVQGILIAENNSSVETVEGTFTNECASRVETTTTNYNFTVDASKYELWLVQNGYQKLRDAAGYKNTTTGTVDAGVGGVQSVDALKMKDNTGKYLILNKNYGDKVFGVDPKVSLTAYYYPSVNTNTVYYHQTKALSSDFTTNYGSDSWQTNTLSGYEGIYGGNPSSLTSYIITSSTITSYSNLEVTSTGFKFTLGLNTDSGTANYRKQMKQLSNQDASFNYVNLTYYVTFEGVLEKVEVKEEYSVMSGLATCTGSLTETFSITDGSESIEQKLSGYSIPSDMLNSMLGK